MNTANANAATLGLRAVATRQNDALFTLDRSNPRNVRVLCMADAPANTFVAAYPGWVFPERAFERLVQAGRRGTKYAVTMFATTPSGGLNFDFVIDPTNSVNRVSPRFQDSFGPFINEPGPGQEANVRWVYNFFNNAMEYWTARPVRRGEELLICYGNQFERNYSTGCARALQDGYIVAPGQKPRTWTGEAEKQLKAQRRALFAQQRGPAPGRGGNARSLKRPRVSPNAEHVMRTVRQAFATVPLHFCLQKRKSVLEEDGEWTWVYSNDVCVSVQVPADGRTPFGAVADAALAELKKARPRAAIGRVTLQHTSHNLLGDRRKTVAQLGLLEDPDLTVYDRATPHVTNLSLE